MLVRSGRTGPLLVTLATVLGASAAVTWSAPQNAVADGRQRASFTRTVEPLDPANPPATPPAVDLTAACVRLVPGGQLEAVFGYQNRMSRSILVRLEADRGPVDGNVIVRDTFRGWPPRPTVAIEDLGPQVTLFKPGDQPHAFAVRFKLFERVAWQVQVPSEQGVAFGVWKVTVRPHLLAPCRRNVPKHFAVVQHVDLGIPGPSIRVMDAPPPHIVAYSVAFDATNERVACSPGGEVTEIRRLLGWPQEINLEPIEPEYLVEIGATTPPTVYEMTTINERFVNDVFMPVSWLGPIADVYATCVFGDGIAETDVYWAETAGNGRVDPVIEGDLVVDLDHRQDAPGASRLR